MLNKNNKKRKGASAKVCAVSQEQRKPLLALTGQYQNGKSTFLNCLLGGPYAIEGNGLITTKYNAKYIFGDCVEARIIHKNGRTTSLESTGEIFSAVDTLQELDKNALMEISVYSPILTDMDVLDSPGCGANKVDDSVATTALDIADFVIFIVQKALDNESDIPFIKDLTSRGKHFTVILNCLNDCSPLSEQSSRICDAIFAKLKNEGLTENYVHLSNKFPVYPVNLLCR